MKVSIISNTYARTFLLDNDARYSASEPLFFVRYTWAILNVMYGDSSWMIVSSKQSSDHRNICRWSGIKCDDPHEFDGEFTLRLSKYCTSFFLSNHHWPFESHFRIYHFFDTM